MSSILEALKKAERESASDRTADTPWPAPLSEPRPYRPRSTRRWIILGLVGFVCVGILVFWLFQQDRKPETVARAPLPPKESPTTTSKPPLVAHKPEPIPKVTPVKPSRSPTQQPQTVPPQRTAAVAKASPPAATESEAHPGQKPFSSVDPSATASSTRKSPSLQPNQRRYRASDPAAGFPAEQVTAPPESIAEASEGSTSAEENIKNFRNDPRIELQALVWAPETASRFVVINNRLVKEGGSFDNIVVMEINRDDVLLSEGSDRWYEKFRIR